MGAADERLREERTATVTQLWRFPVKSMGGSTVQTIRVDRRGAHADRLWAVRDIEKGVTASARRVPVLLGCAARYVTEPGPDAGPGNVPSVVVTFPTAASSPTTTRRFTSRCRSWSAGRCGWPRCHPPTTPASTA